MKIACISTSTVPSTTANSIQMMKVCHAMKQNGADVHLYIPGGQCQSWQVLADHYGLVDPFNITWVAANPSLKRYDFAWFALQQARAWGADLIYTWLLPAATIASWQGCPVVLELHDRITGRLGPWWFRRLMRSKHKKRILTITHALKKRLENDHPIQFQPGEVAISPNGVDSEHYSNLPDPAQARRELNLPAILTAGYTGHFYRGRGSDLLFELAKRFHQINFLWVGGRPDDVTFWQNRCNETGINNLILTGFMPNIRLPLYQAAAEILLMPYEQQIAGSSGGNSADICSPMKMFDYLAAGRAILSSELPVLHEVLNPGNAIFCPPGDIDAWSTALNCLINNPARMMELGNRARQDSIQYSWRIRAGRALEGCL